MALELNLLKPDTTPSFYESVKTLSNDEHSQFLKKTVTLSLLPRMKQRQSDPYKMHKLRMRLEHGPIIGPMMFWKKQTLEPGIPGFKFCSVTSQPCGLGHIEPAFAQFCDGKNRCLYRMIVSIRDNMHTEVCSWVLGGCAIKSGDLAPSRSVLPLEALGRQMIKYKKIIKVIKRE